MYSIDKLTSVANMNQGDVINTGLPQSTEFKMELKQTSIGKIIAYSATERGNIFLYDVADLTILLCLPPGITPNFSKEDNVKHSGSKTYETESGLKSGYPLYKNNKIHIDLIDKMFPNSYWREKLSSPLPELKVKSEPVLMLSVVIYHGGENVPASLYEYNEKQLVVFCKRDLAGDKAILSYWNRYVCPEAPSGYSEGYAAWKNNSRSINFLKTIFKCPDLESRYVKSTPVQYTSVQVEQQYNHFIMNKAVMFGGNTYIIDVVEISPLALTVFFEPPLGIQGFENNWKSVLNHPVKGKIGGFMIPKGASGHVEYIQKTFGLDSFEDNYVLTEEEIARATDKIVTQSPNNNKTTLADRMSSMSINSMSEIPIITLIRLLCDKIDTTEYYNKQDVSGAFLIIGENQKVIDDAANLDDMETKIEIIYGDKRVILLK